MGIQPITVTCNVMETTVSVRLPSSKNTKKGQTTESDKPNIRNIVILHFRTHLVIIYTKRILAKLALVSATHL